MLTHSTKPEMYPEYVIVSWDSLILLLDAEKIEWKVQLDAEKNLNVYAKYKLQEKTASHDTQICDSWKQFVSTDRLFSHSVFRCKFSDLSPKAIVFSHHFPQSLVLSLLCLNSHLLRTLSELFFWWDNRWHCRSANNNLPFQSILSLLHAFQENFQL